MGEFTVVGQQDETLGVRVQTAHVKKSLPGHDSFGNQVTDARATKVVCHRRLPALGLVQSQILVFFVDDHARTIHSHDGCLRIDTQALLQDDFSVDLDPTGGNQLLGTASRGDPGLREDLLQSHAAFDVRRTVAADIQRVLLARRLRVVEPHLAALHIGCRPRFALGPSTFAMTLPESFDGRTLSAMSGLTAALPCGLPTALSAGPTRALAGGTASFPGGPSAAFV